MWWLFSVALACNWTETKRVRDFVSHKFAPFLRENSVKARSACPLKNLLARDTLADYEEYKNKQGVASWGCQKCGRTFKTEDFLEQHIIKVHFTVSKKKSCIADSCYYLPCFQPDPVYSSRCEKTMEKCFNEDLWSPAKELCKYTLYESFDLYRPLYIFLIIVTCLGSLVFYMIIWAEYEDSPRGKKE